MLHASCSISSLKKFAALAKFSRSSTAYEAFESFNTLQLSFRSTLQAYTEAFLHSHVVARFHYDNVCIMLLHPCECNIRFTSTKPKGKVLVNQIFAQVGV